MAIRTEKTENGQDIVIDGFEQGIAASPHKGIANIQNGNISTETGEVTASFVRTQQSMTSSATGTGSLSYADGSHVNLSISGSNNRFKGQWITVTNSSNTTQLPNGTYYVPLSSGSTFQLANYWNTLTFTTPATINYIMVGGGGGGGMPTTSAGTGSGGGGGGQVKSGTTTVTGQAYTITVGGGGAGATTPGNGTAGTASSGMSITAAGGAGGLQAGAGGASGSGNTGGAGTSGGGGGAGDSANGSANSGINGGNGGNGTSVTNLTATTTFGGGGGGGSYYSGSSGTGGTAGTGGGGTGGTISVNGTAGTVNTGGGGGGGGSSGIGSNSQGANGGSGYVEIWYPANSIIGATGGAISYVSSGAVSYKIHKFTSSGTFTVPTPTPTTLSGFTNGLTATIQLVSTMGAPLAQANETYFSNGIKYERYYVLDSNNLVWVYDTKNESLYSASDNASWFLPDFHTDWCTGASGLGYISGFLVATAKNGIYGKSTALLGNTNSTATTWVPFINLGGWSGGAINSPHYVFTGHQGRMYITDSNYISEVYPLSTIASTSASQVNTQTFCSWTRYLGGNPQFDCQFSVINGTSPITTDSKRVPAVFFTQNGGALPSSITAGTVYYISSNTNYFDVYNDPSIPAQQTMTLTAPPSLGDTSATLSASWGYKTGTYQVTFGNGDVRLATLTNNSTAISWTPGLSSSTIVGINVNGALDMVTGSYGMQYFNSFYPISTGGAYTSSTPTFLYTPQRVVLPPSEIAQCIAEIGNYALIGCNGNIVYPWDQKTNLPFSLIPLPESNVNNIITVNQMAYVFAGNAGNVYITDGNIASLVINVPDYVAGVPGSPATYIESQYVWGGANYVRGRVYFSLQDQTASKAGNCGGIWSFVPTQNLYIGQDTGIALRLEAQNSYNTYNGYAPLIIRKNIQDQIAPLYWSVWSSDFNLPTYGIDYSTNGTSASSPVVIETDALPVGTMLTKGTFSQLEYKLASPLDNGANITAAYRNNITDPWTPCNPFNTENSGLSGYATVNFQKSQWLQFQFTLTPITSTASTNTFIRFREIRLR